MSKGNEGTIRLIRAIQAAVSKQLPTEQTIDFGVIKADYSLLTNTYPVPIPKGEWSVLRYLLSETGDRIQPGDRVVVVWAGNEAVVIGSAARI